MKRNNLQYPPPPTLSRVAGNSGPLAGLLASSRLWPTRPLADLLQARAFPSALALFAGMAALLLTAPPAVAQQATDEEAQVVEEIVVTGSRIRRNEFSSPSPIQVIDGDVIRELALFDVGELLQTTPQSSGQQIDNTFGGFVLDNGPGSVTLGFRGLGPGRTLALLNGRRIPPAGVGGAPVSADLSLIPGAMIERIENLFDGASTIYGSDAVAGVANVILQTDINGFVVTGAGNSRQYGGAEVRDVSMMWGTSSDRGHFQIGAEYYDRTQQSIKDSPFLPECEGFIHQTSDGRTIKGNRNYGPTARTESDGYLNCDIFPLTNRVQLENFYGSLYYTPGYTNTGPGSNPQAGIPNLSETTVDNGFRGLLPHWVGADSNGDGALNITHLDGDGDGLRDVDLQDPLYNWQRSPYAQSADFVSPRTTFSLLATGEYAFQDSGETELFGELFYAQRKNDFTDPGSQIFEWVPASNPFNPCGSDPSAVDCLGVTQIARTPTMANPSPIFESGPIRTRPIVNIRGDRDSSDVKIEQAIAVVGVRGNLGFMDNFGAGGWTYEAYLQESRSKGVESRFGISEPRLLHSLNTSVRNADGSVTCPRYEGHDGTVYRTAGIETNVSIDCVPVNLFAENIYQLGGGTLTPAEANYLFVDRATTTEVDSRIVNAFITGDLFTFPWNDEPVPMVFGAEYRKETIASDPNEAAFNGLLWGWFADKGADGSRSFKEVFTEFEFPLLRGAPWAEELTMTAAARWTDESFYDPATTYNAKLWYRPVNWFTIRATHGTSYRAPDLRQRFLNGTTGFVTITDPCVVPSDARDTDMDPDTPDTYDADEDMRQPHILSSCRAQGIDPTSLGLEGGFLPQTSTEIETGGTEVLVEEESTSSTYGFVFEQPFWENFDLTLSVTQFDIELTSAIAEPSGGFIVADCFNNIEFPNGESGFCSRITRDATTQQLSLIDATFINTGLETSKGVDVNIRYDQDFVVGDENLSVILDIVATRMEEQFESILDTTDDNRNETDVPDWRALSQLSFLYQDYRLTWSTGYIDGGRENATNWNDDGEPCNGLADVVCRPKFFTDDYVVHDLSLGWADGDNYVFFVVGNVFNTPPPQVDGAGVFSTRNYPLGIGYDPFGRTYTLSFGATFQGGL